MSPARLSWVIMARNDYPLYTRQNRYCKYVWDICPQSWGQMSPRGFVPTWGQIVPTWGQMSPRGAQVRVTGLPRRVSDAPRPTDSACPESDESYVHRYDSSTPSGWDRQHMKVTCPHCQKLLTRRKLSQHVERMHGISPVIIPPVPEPTIAVAYHLSMPTHPLASVRCPVPACPASFKTRSRIRSHFACRHPQDTLLIAEEGPLLQCP